MLNAITTFLWRNSMGILFSHLVLLLWVCNQPLKIKEKTMVCRINSRLLIFTYYVKKNSEIKTQEKRNLKINLKNLLLNTLEEKNGQFISLYFPFFLSPDGVVLTLATEFVLYTLYFERELNCIATRKALTKYFKHYWRKFTESLQFDNLG